MRNRPPLPPMYGAAVGSARCLPVYPSGSGTGDACDCVARSTVICFEPGRMAANLAGLQARPNRSGSFGLVNSEGKRSFD
jgi:hypothetical protein